jgi:hypothetical protein
MFKFVKKIVELGQHYTWLKEILSPVAVTMATFITGYLQSVPIMWIIMASSVALWQQM